MTKRVALVLVCEDKQHRVFARRFLKAMGWDVNRLRVESAPSGRGAADQFVRSRYAKELKVLSQGAVLLTMLDGDEGGMHGRLRELEHLRGESGLAPPDRDQVFVFVPTWNIETWLAYLSGENVDESKSDYPKLDRPRTCQTHVGRLAEMCRKHALRQPAPPSLVQACDEYDRLASTA